MRSRLQIVGVTLIKHHYLMPLTHSASDRMIRILNTNILLLLVMLNIGDFKDYPFK